MIEIGTAGYSYNDWVGPFYPPGTKKGDMLSCYSREFSLVEVNSTYYRIPRADFFNSILKRVPREFMFIVKANQSFTHHLEEMESSIESFRQVLQPLVASGNLAAVLLQFPYSFRNEAETRDYLQRVREIFPELPLAVEFRHRSWVQEAAFDFFKTQQLAFVGVDEPSLPGLLPPLAVITAPFGYVRFHGRNASRWWNHRQPHERYDYLYTLEELEEWLPRIHSLEKGCEKVFVIFNNHFCGKAVHNARMLKQALAKGE